MVGEGFYEPVRFSGWPELKEAFLSGDTDATFILAPLAMKLREQGVAIKVVYLGHRDGTALMVHKDSHIYSFRDLKGKRLAVPNRFSNQFLIIYKALHDYGMKTDDVEIVEMPPPDMPAALYARAVDLITSGEPFMGQTELDGYGRVLYQAKELWPNFISCVLAVRERIILDHPEWVKQLVDGIAKSGKWLQAGMDHRMKAADAVATLYYNQNPRLLRFVLSKPPDRVSYGDLTLIENDWRKIAELAAQGGILTHPMSFQEICDPTFSRNTNNAVAYNWNP